ncbi:MAG: tetratricopeptide repeat protein [Myxococcaceae bacterium]|nr:tetratricopeptide repeat protein [Myxococcaceae bacterium]
MAENSNPVIPNKGEARKPEVTPDWDKVLYAPERVEKWLRGEITLQELNAISGPEMLEMAVIGFSMYEQGRYEEAKVIFQGLCTLDPKEGYYRTALGAVFLAQEDLDNALNMFNAAIALNDKEIASFVNRGEVYLRQGKIIEAAHDFKRAVDLDPENKDPLSHRARILAAAALETLEQAQKLAENKNKAPAKKDDGKAPAKSAAAKGAKARKK